MTIRMQIIRNLQPPVGRNRSHRAGPKKLRFVESLWGIKKMWFDAGILWFLPKISVSSDFIMKNNETMEICFSNWNREKAKQQLIISDSSRFQLEKPSRIWSHQVVQCQFSVDAAGKPQVVHWPKFSWLLVLTSGFPLTMANNWRIFYYLSFCLGMYIPCSSLYFMVKNHDFLSIFYIGHGWNMVKPPFFLLFPQVFSTSDLLPPPGSTTLPATSRPMSRWKHRCLGFFDTGEKRRKTWKIGENWWLLKLLQ